MDTLFIINPISGNGRKKDIISLLEAEGLKYVITKAGGEAEEIARNCDESTIVAVGGDGTVNEVARGLLGSDKTLGIIPCGSGDGLALCLGISRNIRKALDTVLHGQTVLIDRGSINSRPFFSVCGTGFDADVSKLFAQSGKRGLENYVLQAMHLWKDFSPLDYEISLDGQSFSRKAVLLTVANSNQWGNQAKVAPHANCSDGLLDLTALDMFSSIELPALATLLMTGHCDSSRRVHCYKAREIIIRRPFAAPAHCDGDWFDAPEELRIKIHPQELKVIVNRVGKND